MLKLLIGAALLFVVAFGLVPLAIGKLTEWLWSRYGAP